MKSLRENPEQTYKELLRSVRCVPLLHQTVFVAFLIRVICDMQRRAILHSKYSQKPQLSSSHKIVCSPRICVHVRER